MADKPKPGYQFIDDSGHSYNVRKVKGVRSRVFATGKTVQAPRPTGTTNGPTTSRPQTGGTSASGAKLPVARFQTWSPEHQRQSLKFYGGDSMTTADFYALPPDKQRQIMERVRQGRAAAVAPDSATRTQTVNDINIAAEQAAGLKYGSTQRQIGVDEKASDIQQGNITGWFQQYQDILKQSAADNAAASKAAVDQVSGDAVAAEAAAQATQGQVQQAAATDAATRGATVDPALAAQAAQASASRTASENLIKGTIAGQGATTAAYGGNLKGVAANQGVQAHLAESATKKNLKNKLRDLLTEKGQYEATTRQDLTAAERKNALETAAFNLDVTTQTDKSAQAKADAKAKRDKQKSDDAIRRGQHYGPGSPVLNKYGFTADQWDTMSEADRAKARKGKSGSSTKPDAPKTGPGSVSQAEENKRVTQVNQLLTIMRNPPRWPGGPRKGQLMTADEVAHHYAATGTDGRIIHVAVSLFRNHDHLGPDGVNNAHDLGIHVNGRWKRVPAAKPTTQTTPPQTPGPSGQNRPN